MSKRPQLVSPELTQILDDAEAEVSTWPEWKRSLDPQGSLSQSPTRDSMSEPNVLTFEQFDEACKRADVLMKVNQGHSYIHILKTRCQYCGRSPRQKGKCSQWFSTFLKCLAGELTGIYESRDKVMADKAERTPRQKDWRIRLAKAVGRGRGITLSREETRLVYNDLRESAGTTNTVAVHGTLPAKTEGRDD